MSELSADERRLWRKEFRLLQARRANPGVILVATLDDGTKWDRANGVEKFDFPQTAAIDALWSARRKINFRKRYGL